MEPEHNARITEAIRTQERNMGLAPGALDGMAVFGGIDGQPYFDLGDGPLHPEVAVREYTERFPNSIPQASNMDPTRKVALGFNQNESKRKAHAPLNRPTSEFANMTPEQKISLGYKLGEKRRETEGRHIL